MKERKAGKPKRIKRTVTLGEECEIGPYRVKAERRRDGRNPDCVVFTAVRKTEVDKVDEKVDNTGDN